MPSPLYVTQRLDATTRPFGYIRLLGDRNKVDRLTKKLDHIVIDRQDQIEADALAIKLLTARARAAVRQQPLRGLRTGDCPGVD